MIGECLKTIKGISTKGEKMKEETSRIKGGKAKTTGGKRRTGGIRRSAETKTKERQRRIKGVGRTIREFVKIRDGRRMIEEGSGSMTTRDRANRRNTINTKRGNTTLVLMTLSLRRAGSTRTRRTTSEGNSGGSSERMVTKTANTSPNKNILQTIVWARSPRNSCLCVRRDSVESRRAVRARQVAAIPAITLRNRSSTATNTPMTVKPTIKNSTRAAAREPAITDL